MLSYVTNQPKSTIELGYMCPRGLSGPPAVTLTEKLKYKKDINFRKSNVITFVGVNIATNNFYI